jgi:hypothetical protein
MAPQRRSLVVAVCGPAADESHSITLDRGRGERFSLCYESTGTAMGLNQRTDTWNASD